MGFLRKIVIQIPKGHRNLCSLITGSLHQLYIGGVFTILQQIADTLGGFLPGYDLSGRCKTGSLSSGKMNTLLIKPCADLMTVQLKAIAATIEFRQTLCNLLRGFSFHIFQRHHHSEIRFIAANSEHLVDLIFR